MYPWFRYLVSIFTFFISAFKQHYHSCAAAIPYVKELEGRRGSADTLRVVFHGAEDAEECVRVVNLQGKMGSRTLLFHDVCRTLDENVLREFFVGRGAVVEHLELFRTGEEDGRKSKGCGVVLLSDPADAERLEGELDLPPRRGQRAKPSRTRHAMLRTI